MAVIFPFVPENQKNINKILPLTPPYYYRVHISLVDLYSRRFRPRASPNEKQRSIHKFPPELGGKGGGGLSYLVPPRIGGLGGRKPENLVSWVFVCTR